MFTKVNVAIIYAADKDDDGQRDSETSTGWDPPIGLIGMLIDFLDRAAGWDEAAGEDEDSSKDVVVEKQERATKNNKEDGSMSDTGRKRKGNG